MDKELFFTKINQNKGYRRLLEGELQLMIMCHFPTGIGDHVTCDSCQDFHIGVCDGRGLQGEGLVDCMVDHLSDPTLEIEKKIKAKRKYKCH